MLSRWAISLLERPWSSSSAISSSRAVSDEAGRRAAKFRRQFAHVPQQARGDPRRADDLSTRDAFDDRFEIVESAVPRDVCRGPGLRASDHVRLRLGERQGDDLRVRNRLPDRTDGLETGVRRHVDEDHSG